jgi:glycosyltransferase involved in cell wall biosynthesis
MNPLVSVVMGAYNQERHLPEAIDSILAQTYTNREVIVVDDASTDRTPDVLRGYGERIRVVRRAANSGGCQVPRNDGIRSSHGQYVAFLDHDDAWYPEKLAVQVAFMEQNPDIPLTHTYCQVIDADSRIVETRHENALPPTGPCYRELLRHCFITISSVMVRRDLFDKVGGLFNEDPELLSDDYEFFLRVAKKFSIGLVPKVLTKYRKSTAGFMSSRWRYQPEVVPFYERVLRTPDLWSGAVERDEVVKALLDACLSNAEFWRDAGISRRSLHFALRGIRYAPASARAWVELGRALVRSVLPVSP